MWPLWEGRSCVPTDDSGNSTCTLGAFPVYAVNATNVAQIQLAVNFARNQGLRLVIKNTGHDYQGRSTGAGALSIWTHNLQGLNYLPKYTLGKFSGNALHIAAGVVTQDIAEMAENHDGSVVGGMCAVSVLFWHVSYLLSPSYSSSFCMGTWKKHNADHDTL
jgi:hypothetical protein